MIYRCLALFAVLILTNPCWGELLPEEIGILAAQGNRESAALATYYAKQRKIPAENICQVAVPTGEELDRATWEATVRPAIRSWFDENGRREKIRCLTTTWGIPIRIGAAPADALAPMMNFYQTEFTTRIDALAEFVESAEEQAGISGDAEDADDVADRRTDVASASAEPGEKDVGAGADIRALDKLAKRLEIAVAKMQSDADTLPPAELQQLDRRLQELVTNAGGLAAIYEGYAKSLQNTPSPTRPMIEQISALRGQIIGLTESRGFIERQQLPTIAREQMLLILVQRAGGLIQTLRWLNERIAATEKNESQASFDSELSLVHWPDYTLLRWQTNFLNATARNTWMNTTHPTIMVSRIDAPTLKLAKGLIDQAIETEERGLAGKVYLDARGLAKSATAAVGADANAIFDQQILRTAEYLRTKDMDVVLNQETELFQPGECPDAALYCGWYSLANYRDAFDWSPGAVGFHVASAEAITLKTADSNVWCKRMLEDGVCATLGPVGEPYLQGFPQPAEFFGALVAGNSLVESYYRSKPFNSWMMMLIGDPLYRPFGE